MRILLDTSILVEGERRNFDLGAWVEKNGHEVLICDATITEYIAGKPVKDAGKIKRWQDYLDTFVTLIPSVPLDREVCEKAGELMAEARKNGFTVPLGDAYHAATAVLDDLTIVTVDREHFKAMGLKPVNPLE